jgi:uncharacterized protein (DUF1697 family)
MTTLVAFLRGINVGGIDIKMVDLARAFEDLGFSEVKTILASGNVRFATDQPNDSALKRRIEAALTERFGYEAWVIVLDLDTVRGIIDAYPFGEDDESKQPWVMFLADPAIADDLLSVAEALNATLERVEVGNGVIYWEVTKGDTIGSGFGKHTARRALGHWSRPAT